jgi:hypothetical protein
MNKLFGAQICLFVLHRFVCSAGEIVCLSCTVLLEQPIVSSTDSSGAETVCLSCTVLLEQQIVSSTDSSGAEIVYL